MSAFVSENKVIDSKFKARLSFTKDITLGGRGQRRRQTALPVLQSTKIIVAVVQLLSHIYSLRPHELQHAKSRLSSAISELRLSGRRKELLILTELFIEDYGIYFCPKGFIMLPQEKHNY